MPALHLCIASVALMHLLSLALLLSFWQVWNHSPFWYLTSTHLFNLLLEILWYRDLCSIANSSWSLCSSNTILNAEVPWQEDILSGCLEVWICAIKHFQYPHILHFKLFSDVRNWHGSYQTWGMISLCINYYIPTLKTLEMQRHLALWLMQSHCILFSLNPWINLV